MCKDYCFDLCLCPLGKTILFCFMEIYKVSYLWINWYAKCSHTQCVTAVSFNIIIYEHWVVFLLEFQPLCTTQLQKDLKSLETAKQHKPAGSRMLI